MAIQAAINSSSVTRSDIQRPVRILHIVGAMNRGGVETWLMHILRHIDRDLFQMDFLVHTDQACVYDEEIRAFGSRIIPCLNPSSPLQYARKFKQILQQYGPYDVVHSHVHHFSGYVLRLAKQAGVSSCIAHSHIDSTPLEAQAGLLRKIYLNLAKSWIKQPTTIKVGCSRKAALDLFGTNWESDTLCHILYYGIDLAPFWEPIDRTAIRSEFGIPYNAFVVGHVGRFDLQKNHDFLLDIAAEVLKREPKSYFLMIGVGTLRETIEQKAERLGLREHCLFAGGRSDVPRLMRGAMDVFLLPSISEGLPVVLIEAQAAGLPCIFTDVITEEADFVQPLPRRLSLSQSASEWAEAVLAQQHNSNKISQSDACKLIESSHFNIEHSLAQLEKLYQAMPSLDLRKK